MLKPLVSFLLLTSPLVAQAGNSPTARFESPMIGFAFDRGSHRLQPIMGIPGAAFMGTPIETGFDISDAVISPRQDYAVALTAKDHQAKLVRWDQGSVSNIDFTGAEAAVDRIVLSPSGTAAALYRATDGVIQVFSGLPDSPVSVWQLQAPAATITVLAVADPGDAIVLSTANDASPLILLGSDGTSSSLSSYGSMFAAAFRPGSHDVLVASNGNNVVLLLQDVLGTMALQQIAGADDGIAAPIGAEFSADGSKAFITNSVPGAVAAIDLSAQTVSVTPCGCRPTGLRRLAGNALFALNEPSDQPMLLFDTGGPSARVIFVPPAQTRSEQ